MSDEFRTGPCSGSWWSSARAGGGLDGPSVVATSNAMASDEAVDSVSDNMAGGSLMNSTLQIPNMDWTRAMLGGRSETSFHDMLQQDFSTRPYNFRQEPSIDFDLARPRADGSSMNILKNMNQSFLMEQEHRQLSSSEEQGNCSISNFPLGPALNGCSSSVLQCLIEPNKSENYQSQMTGYRRSPSELPQPSSWPKFPQFLASSPPKQPPSSIQLQFSNNTPFWNPSATGISEARSGFYQSVSPQISSQTFEEKPNFSNVTMLSDSDSARCSSSSTSKKSSSSEPPLKKPRTETPSPLPTFKVRKEKLGDRITALQQLVSPFGKTDTASVLHEAFEYIKFLHEQVSVLSTTPYLKNGHPMLQQNMKDGDGPKEDLRSRGLCLVPIENTYQVAGESPADFWSTPNFGGTYR